MIDFQYITKLHFAFRKNAKNTSGIFFAFFPANIIAGKRKSRILACFFENRLVKYNNIELND